MKKTYPLNLDENELRYLLHLISVVEDILSSGTRQQRAMVQEDSRIKPKILELISDNINLQTFFSKPYEPKQPKYQYKSK